MIYKKSKTFYHNEQFQFYTKIIQENMKIMFLIY